MLKVIGNERVQEVRNVEDPDQRSDQGHEDGARRGRSAAPTSAPEPEYSCRGSYAQGKEILPPGAHVDVPARVDGQEPSRPDQFSDVEPEGSPRDQESGGEGKLPIHGTRA